MRVRGALLAGLLLGSCGDQRVDAARSAERQFQILVDGGASSDDRCQAAGAAAAAWLKAERPSQYRTWAARQKSECNAAAIDARLRS